MINSLFSLDDFTVDVRDEIQKSWEKCGEQYFEENEAELGPLELIDEIPPNYPSCLIRPSIGCRAICSRSLKLIDRTLTEMEDWKPEIRLQSTTLLKQMLIHCEKSVTPNLTEIVPVLAERCADQSEAVADEAIKGANLISILIDFQDWKPHTLENVLPWKYLGNLVCFTVMLANVPETIRWTALEETLDRIISTEVYFEIDEGKKKHFIVLLELLVHDYLDHRTDELERKLYRILVTTWSFHEDDEGMQRVQNLLELFASGESLSKCHERNLGYVLREIEDLDCNDQLSILLLHRLVIICGIRGPYFDELIDRITTVLRLDGMQEDKVKLLSGISVVAKQWKETMACDANEDNFKRFIDEVLLPSLVWRAGLSAEAIRSMAMVALFAMSQSDPDAAGTVLPGCLPILLQVLDDQNANTRRFASKAMLLVSPMEVDALRKTATSKNISKMRIFYF